MIVPESVATATFDGDEAFMVVSKPSGTVDGNHLLAACTTRNGGAIYTPAGWTLIDSQKVTDIDAKWFWRLAAGEASSYVFSWANDTGVFGAAGIFRLSGVHATTPINVAQKNSTASPAGTAALPQVTTTAADCLLVYLGYQRQGSAVTRSVPSGTASHWSLNSATGFSGHWLGAASIAQAVEGLSVAKSWNTAGTQAFGGVTIALAPAAPSVVRSRRRRDQTRGGVL